jgi:hypothetical protein
MLERYSPAELIGFARRLDPGLTAEDFADAGNQLDHIGDDEFSRYGLSQPDIAALRIKFAAWPRTPQAVPQQMPRTRLRESGARAEPKPRSGPARNDPNLASNRPCDAWQRPGTLRI